MKPIKDYRILIWSENPDELVKFYRDFLGLKEGMKLDLPDDYGTELLIPDKLGIWIGKHSEVHGKNKDPFRHIFNLYVDDVHAWYDKIKAHPDIEIIQEPMVTPPTRGQENPRYVFTFLDPEGNCLQFMTAA